MSITGAIPPRATGRRKRVLLVAYQFPPVGGSGVQRATKFVKYLPQHGWDVSVLTVTNPSVPLYDASLLADVPTETVLHRARTLEPGYAVKASVAGAAPGKHGRLRRLAAKTLRRVGASLMQPDPQILWLPAAVAAGRRLLRQTPHDVVLATAPPFTDFLVGAALSRTARLPLVLDYRDEWTISNAHSENKRLGPLSLFVQGRMQAWVLRSARGVVATTRSSAESLAMLGRRVGSRAAVTWIYNGFDPDDFGASAPTSTDPSFRLAYVGTLWNLASAAPLVEAVVRLSRDRPDLAAGLELTVAGRRIGLQAGYLAALRGLPCRLVERPYLEHGPAVGLMKSASALCLLLSDLPGAGRVVPAKLFEYLATARPILAIAPRGETWDLLASRVGATCFLPSDTAGVAAWLGRSVEDHRAGVCHTPHVQDASAYDRVHEAGQLAHFLDVCASARVPASPHLRRI